MMRTCPVLNKIHTRAYMRARDFKKAGVLAKDAPGFVAYAVNYALIVTLTEEKTCKLDQMTIA